MAAAAIDREVHRQLNHHYETRIHIVQNFHWKDLTFVRHLDVYGSLLLRAVMLSDTRCKHRSQCHCCWAWDHPLREFECSWRWTCARVLNQTRHLSYEAYDLDQPAGWGNEKNKIKRTSLKAETFHQREPRLRLVNRWHLLTNLNRGYMS